MPEFETNAVYRETKLAPERLAEKLQGRFGHRFSCDYKKKPTGDILWIQDTDTKKVFRLKAEEVRWAGNPFARICERIISRIEKDEYDNFRSRDGGSGSDKARFRERLQMGMGKLS
jgi:hypothetical protein